MSLSVSSVIAILFTKAVYFILRCFWSAPSPSVTWHVRLGEDMNVIMLRACTDCKWYCFCSNLAIIIIVIDSYHCYQIWCCMHSVDEKLQTWLLAVMHYVFIYNWLFEQWMFSHSLCQMEDPGDCCFVDLIILLSPVAFLCFIYEYNLLKAVNYLLNWK